MPELVEAGMIYKSVPPLYKIKIGKKIKYIADGKEYASYVQDQIAENIEVYQDGNKLGKKDIIGMLIDHSTYVEELERLSKRFVCEPKLLEYVAMYYDKVKDDIKSFAKRVSKDYKFLKVDVDKRIIKGSLNKEKVYLKLDEFTLTKIKPIHKQLSIYDNIIFQVNGEDKTLYEVMRVFKAYEPADRQRFKGSNILAPYMGDHIRKTYLKLGA